jgi:hypothetical protein
MSSHDSNASLKYNNQIHFVGFFFVFQEFITAQGMDQVHPVPLAVHLPVLVPVPVAPVPVKNMEHTTSWIGNN